MTTQIQHGYTKTTGRHKCNMKNIYKFGKQTQIVFKKIQSGNTNTNTVFACMQAGIKGIKGIKENLTQTVVLVAMWQPSW